MTQDSLIDNLHETFRSPKALQSNYVRDHACAFARLACLGLITTAWKNTYGNHWRITHKGLRVLSLGNTE